MALLAAAPSDGAVVTTVFLVAYGVVPAIAMAACSVLAAALITKYPARNHARSLALLSVSVGLTFGQFFFPTLVHELDLFGVRLLPGAESLSGGINSLVFGLVVALSPAWLFWFSATFPDTPRRTESRSPTLELLARIQRLAFRTPAVLVFGMLPFGIGVMTDGKGFVAVGLGTLGVGMGSLWLSHLLASEQLSGRTWVVMGLLAMPALPLVLWPLADLSPQLSPFFRFDLMVPGTGVALCAMALGLAYAVFVQGVVGPALVLRRGLWLGGGGALLVFLFAGLENVLTDQVVARIGLPGNLGTFLSAGVIAVVITAARDSLRKRRDASR